MDPRKKPGPSLGRPGSRNPKRDVPLLELGTGYIDIFDRESQVVMTWVLNLGTRHLGHPLAAHNMQLLASVVLFEVHPKSWNRWDMGSSAIVLQTEQSGVEIMRLRASSSVGPMRRPA
jgi:hypothetical protein